MSAMPESTLADLQQSNADLQRENAELRRTLDEAQHERDEALQRETATAEVLGVINSSPGDLAPVFDAVLDNAMRLCDVANGHVFRMEGDLVRAVAARGEPGFVDWMQQRGAVFPVAWSSG